MSFYLNKLNFIYTTIIKNIIIIKKHFIKKYKILHKYLNKHTTMRHKNLE